MDIKRKYNFSLKPYGKNKEYYLIRLRVSYPGNRVDFSTGCNVLTEDAWNPEVQKVKKGYLSVKGEKAAAQNKVLENIIKDGADVPDMEEAEEVIREAEAENAE